MEKPKITDGGSEIGHPGKSLRTDAALQIMAALYTPCMTISACNIDHQGMASIAVDAADALILELISERRRSE